MEVPIRAQHSAPLRNLTPVSWNVPLHGHPTHRAEISTSDTTVDQIEGKQKGRQLLKVRIIDVVQDDRGRIRSSSQLNSRTIPIKDNKSYVLPSRGINCGCMFNQGLKEVASNQWPNKNEARCTMPAKQSLEITLSYKLFENGVDWHGSSHIDNFHTISLKG
jgi:hypothetical protein